MKLRNFIYGATILIVYVRFFCLYVFRGGKMRGKFVYIHAIQFFVKHAIQFFVKVSLFVIIIDVSDPFFKRPQFFTNLPIDLI